MGVGGQWAMPRGLLCNLRLQKQHSPSPHLLRARPIVVPGARPPLLYVWCRRARDRTVPPVTGASAPSALTPLKRPALLLSKMRPPPALPPLKRAPSHLPKEQRVLTAAARSGCRVSWGPPLAGTWCLGGREKGKSGWVGRRGPRKGKGQGKKRIVPGGMRKGKGKSEWVGEG